MIGSALWHWTDTTPQLAYLAFREGNFTETEVTYTNAKVVRDACVALGWLGYEPGKRFYDSETTEGRVNFRGHAARFWPTQKLLDAAIDHGLTADVLRSGFQLRASRKAPTVGDVIRLTSFKRFDRPRPEQLWLSPDDPEYRDVREGVERHNRFAATFDVAGVTPPRWTRRFTMDKRLHGRWYAAGRDQSSVYMQISEASRLQRVRINGEPVVEADISASHLSIVHGLSGVPLPDGDLYDLGPGIPRDVAKAYVTSQLGNGRFVPEWTKTADPNHRGHSAQLVFDATLSRYPFLRDVADLVPADLRKRFVQHQRMLLTLYLMGVEAAGLTGVLHHFAAEGTLALPIHDGLLLPASAAGKVQAYVHGAFGYVARVYPRVTLHRWDEAARRVASIPVRKVVQDQVDRVGDKLSDCGSLVP